MYRQLTQMLTAARLISRSQGASLKQLEEHIGVSNRTVYRILQGLEELGYVMYDDRVMLDYLFREVAKAPSLAPCGSG
ncbi:MAG TPA: helix-turn-helix domain-containing protein [Treponemataceae bacterium]|nr:helix-turn-helix domain-containing protein [Treponemataceae bacterium]